MHCVVRFPAQWITATHFERALRHSCGPHDASSFEVSFEFPAGCKVMVDTAIRLLSLVNQLASTTRRVRLNFEEGETGTMGYLNRMGFFDCLADAVEVLPPRPAYSAAEVHRGANAWRASIRTRDEEPPTRLTALSRRAIKRIGRPAELLAVKQALYVAGDYVGRHHKKRIDRMYVASRDGSA